MVETGCVRWNCITHTEKERKYVLVDHKWVFEIDTTDFCSQYDCTLTDYGFGGKIKRMPNVMTRDHVHWWRANFIEIPCTLEHYQYFDDYQCKMFWNSLAKYYAIVCEVVEFEANTIFSHSIDFFFELT